MAHNVEKMFYVSNEENGRFVPWHGLGTPVKEALTSEEALKVSGLDWTVEQKPIFTDGREIPNYRANIRSCDGGILGVVTDKYKIVQNTEAFEFTDSLFDEGARYETAGSLKNGKTVWLLARMPQQKILDEAFDPYVVFTNSHDGSGAVKVACVPIRVVCNNTLNMALAKASRSWSTKHMGNMQSKLDEAKRALGLMNSYMDALGKEADKLANSPMSFAEVNEVLDEMFPIDEDASDRQKANVKKVKDDIMVCYFMPDIKKYVDTKYGFLNAVSDWCGHSTPARNTADYRDNNWGRIMNGHPVFDMAYSLITK